MKEKSCQFKLGDVVKLKSGGPQMTIEALPGSNDQTIDCKWFSLSDDRTCYSDCFEASSLELVKK